MLPMRVFTVSSADNFSAAFPRTSGSSSHFCLESVSDCGASLQRLLDAQPPLPYARPSIYRRSTMPKQALNPLPSAAFQILLSLAFDDLHGYGIMRQVA